MADPGLRPFVQARDGTGPGLSAGVFPDFEHEIPQLAHLHQFSSAECHRGNIVSIVEKNLVNR
jgi:hypothetical protein